MLVSLRQAFVVLGAQPPAQNTLQVLDTLLQRGCLRIVARVQRDLDLAQALDVDALIGRCEQIRSRRGEYGLQALFQVVALFHPQTDLRIELAELRIDRG